MTYFIFQGPLLSSFVTCVFLFSDVLFDVLFVLQRKQSFGVVASVARAFIPLYSLQLVVLPVSLIPRLLLLLVVVVGLSFTPVLAKKIHTCWLTGPEIHANTSTSTHTHTHQHRADKMDDALAKNLLRTLISVFVFVFSFLFFSF